MLNSLYHGLGGLDPATWRHLRILENCTKKSQLQSPKSQSQFSKSQSQSSSRHLGLDLEDWKHPVGITPLLLSLFATKFMTIEMLLLMRWRMRQLISDYDGSYSPLNVPNIRYHFVDLNPLSSKIF